MDEVNQLVTVGVLTVQRAFKVGNDTIHGLQGWARPVGLPRHGRAHRESRTLDIGRAVVSYVCCFATVFAQLERGGCNAT
jgi:hypothetical protein